MPNRRSRSNLAENGDPFIWVGPITSNMLTETSWSGEIEVRYLGKKAVGSAVRGIFNFNIHAVLLAYEVSSPGQPEGESQPTSPQNRLALQRS